MTILKQIQGTKTGRIGLWAASIAGAIGLTAALVACGGGSDFGAAANPTAPTYTVSGTVTNLQVTGLSVLLSAAGSTASFAVPPNQNTFTFTTSLPTSTTYNVAITQQPLGFTQQCALSNGSGTIAQANVNNVAIACHTATAVVSTLAGTTTSGFANGTGTLASFQGQHGIALDGLGNLYVADMYNSAARKIVIATGVVSTIGGGPITTDTNLDDIAADASGNIYVADSYQSVIRKISSAGVASVFAGIVNTPGSADGTTTATFNSPHGLAVDSAGNVYVGDSGNNSIRKITPAGLVSTWKTGITNPYGMAVDAGGNVYVAERSATTIVKISPAGTVSVVAGTTTSGFVDGNGSVARFNKPSKVAIDAAGNLYVGDSGNNAVRLITPAGVVSTLAGSLTGASGAANGVGTAASFNQPWGMAVDAAGVVYVSDEYNNMIRKITPQ